MKALNPNHMDSENGTPEASTEELSIKISDSPGSYKSVAGTPALQLLEHLHHKHTTRQEWCAEERQETSSYVWHNSNAMSTPSCFKWVRYGSDGQRARLIISHDDIV